MEEEQIPRSEVDPNPPSRDPEGHDLRMDGVGSKMMHYSTTSTTTASCSTVRSTVQPPRTSPHHYVMQIRTRAALRVPDPMAMDPYPEVRRGGLLLLMY